MRLPGMKDWIFDTTVDASVRSDTSLCGEAGRIMAEQARDGEFEE